MRKVVQVVEEVAVEMVLLVEEAVDEEVAIALLRVPYP